MTKAKRYIGFAIGKDPRRKRIAEYFQGKSENDHTQTEEIVRALEFYIEHKGSIDAIYDKSTVDPQFAKMLDKHGEMLKEILDLAVIIKGKMENVQVVSTSKDSTSSVNSQGPGEKTKEQDIDLTIGDAADFLSEILVMGSG